MRRPTGAWGPVNATTCGSEPVGHVIGRVGHVIGHVTVGQYRTSRMCWPRKRHKCEETSESRQCGAGMRVLSI
eukprot:3058015-Rhodomonas_salina.2